MELKGLCLVIAIIKRGGRALRRNETLLVDRSVRGSTVNYNSFGSMTLDGKAQPGAALIIS